MRALHETGQFRSLTYRDMPFVLMPGIWKKLSQTFRTYRDEKERAHGDRVAINFDSPEAFEDVFWRTFCGRDYIRNDCLVPHEINDEILELFRQFVDQVVASAATPEQTRYLSKNNNNLLRLVDIRKALPDAVIIIPFRDPVQQAASLLKQHRQFSMRHRDDPFSRSYMHWLGHHEFGLTHKPFRFTPNEAVINEHLDSGDINYWLLRWCEAYEHVLSTMPTNSRLVSYEKLCDSSGDTLDRILQFVNIDAPKRTIKTTFIEAAKRDPGNVDNNLYARALTVYDRLTDHE